MKIAVNWKGVALYFMATTMAFGFFCLFLFFRNHTPPKTSILEKYLNTQNKFLKKEQDSLFLVIKSQNKSISVKDSLLVELANKKTKVKIIYYEKIKSIDTYSTRQLTDEFESVFTKNNVD
jgi:hypothetical protein